MYIKSKHRTVTTSVTTNGSRVPKYRVEAVTSGGVVPRFYASTDSKEDAEKYVQEAQESGMKAMVIENP